MGGARKKTGSGAGSGVLRGEDGKILPGSGPLNPKGRPRGTSQSARLIEACNKEARKLGMSFEEFLAQQAIANRDRALLKLIVDKFIPNAPQKTELEVSVKPTEDEIEKIRAARWDTYSGSN